MVQNTGLFFHEFFFNIDYKQSEVINAQEQQLSAILRNRQHFYNCLGLV